MRALTGFAAALLISAVVCESRTEAQSTLEKVVAPANTRILVAPRRDIYSNTVVVGELISLEVVDEVTIGGRVVIARGEAALVRVAIAKAPASFGRGGELLIEIVETKAVDGSIIALLGEHRIKGAGNLTSTIFLSILAGPLGGRRQEGLPARLRAGTRLEARTERETIIEVRTP